MSRVKAALATISATLGEAFGLLRVWWRELSPAERVLYRAMVLLAVGAGGYDWRLAFIVPGVLFALVFFGFRLGRQVEATDDQTPQEG